MDSLNMLPLIKPYIPEELFCRDDELKPIEAEVWNFKTHNICGNLILDGVTGSGKTTTIQYLLKQHNDVFIYIDCSKLKGSEMDFLNTLANESYKTTTKALQGAIDNLNANRKIYILDELDKIVSKVGRGIWDDLNTLYRETATPLFVITNQKDLLSTMPEDARLTLFLRYVYFRSYKIPEIFKILEQRVKVVGFEFEQGRQEAALSQIAKNAYETGSARTAVDLLRMIVLDNNHNPSVGQIEDYKKRLNIQELQHQMIRMLPVEKKLLYLLAKIFSNPHPHKYITTGIITELFNKSYSPLHANYLSSALTSIHNYYPLHIQAVKINPQKSAGQTRQLFMDPNFAINVIEASQAVWDEVKTKEEQYNDITSKLEENQPT